MLTTSLNKTLRTEETEIRQRHLRIGTLCPFKSQKFTYRQLAFFLLFLNELISRPYNNKIIAYHVFAAAGVLTCPEGERHSPTCRVQRRHILSSPITRLLFGQSLLTQATKGTSRKHPVHDCVQHDSGTANVLAERRPHKWAYAQPSRTATWRQKNDPI